MAIEITGLPQAIPADTSQAKSTQATSTRGNADQALTAGNSRPPVTDDVTITREAKNLFQIEADINTHSEIDSDRVSSLKMEIDNGRYNINPERVAEKFLQFETLLTV